MKKLLVGLMTGLLMLCLSGVVQATTIDWKGVEWEINNGIAVVNPNGSLTLTAITTSTSNAGVYLHANRLSDDFDTIMDPWIQWSFTGHTGDILIEQETFPGPTIQAGSLWDKYWAVTRYTDGNSRPQENFIWSVENDPISHVVNIGKRTDGTVDVKFDFDAWVANEFLKDNVGGDWGFNDVYLRMRTANNNDTITFNDFQYGSNTVVPEPTTLLLFGLGLLGVAGVSRRKN